MVKAKSPGHANFVASKRPLGERLKLRKAVAKNFIPEYSKESIVSGLSPEPGQKKTDRC